MQHAVTHTHNLSMKHKHAVCCFLAFCLCSLTFLCFFLGLCHWLSLCALQYVHMPFIISLVCLIYLFSGVCETLRCAASLTWCFHNKTWLMPRDCINVRTKELGMGWRIVNFFSICWRTQFRDLSNLELTPLKVSYDLIETDYGDNGINHNHVCKLNSGLQI